MSPYAAPLEISTATPATATMTIHSGWVLRHTSGRVCRATAVSATTGEAT